MSRVLVKSRRFETDIALTFGWYVTEAGETIAWRFFESVDRTLVRLVQFPSLGKRRRFRHAELQGLCSFRADPPFEDHLISIEEPRPICPLSV